MLLQCTLSYSKLLHLLTVCQHNDIDTMGDFGFRWGLVLGFGFKPKLGLKPKLSGNLKWRQSSVLNSV